VHHANQGGSRAQFLKKASSTILQFSGAERLDLWLEDNNLSYHWRTLPRNVQGEGKKAFLTESIGERLSLEDSHHTGVKLIERVYSFLEADGLSHTEAHYSGHDGVWLSDAILLPFLIDAQYGGVLGLAKPELNPDNTVERKAYEDLAQFLGVAISIRRAKAALLERVKELTCMYRIAQFAAETHTHIDDILQKIVGLLPGALQYPDIATARITLRERSFHSTGFQEGPHHLSANLYAGRAKLGEVDVYYTQTPPAILDDRQTPIEAAFLPEEQHLIDGVAREISSIIKRHSAEEEKQHLEAQVRHANRLVTIGELAAGVAHELNEPLGNILGFAQLAMKSEELPGQARKDIEKIEKASLYAREVIRKLMFFARQTPSRKIDVNLNRVVEDSLLLLESGCEKAGIEVVRRLEPSLPEILGDPSQLQQVLVNLVVNAIQAMPNGGRLTITTQQNEDCQSMIVEDTGSGIDPDNLKRIFLPFFTTKEVGEGTGLGLSVAYGIVNSHGGSIDVDSKIDLGTRFMVQFPTNVLATRGVVPDDE